MSVRLVSEDFPKTLLTAELAQIQRYQHLNGLPLSAQAFLLSRWVESHPCTLVIAPSVKAQEDLADALHAWGCEAVSFPESLQLGGESAVDPESQAEQFQLLHRLLKQPPRLILSTENARQQAVPNPKHFKKSEFSLKVGQRQPMADFLLRLEQAGYVREKIVTARGQYAVRGGIVDCFSWQGSQPVRLEWEDDAIDSVRQFDPLTQISDQTLKETVISLLELSDKYEHTLHDYLPANTSILYSSKAEAEAWTQCWAEHDFLKVTRHDAVLSENRRQLLKQSLKDWLGEGWRVWMSCHNEAEQHRLTEWLGEVGIPVDELTMVISPLKKGFRWDAGKWCVLADAEIFGRYQNIRVQQQREGLLQRRRASAVDVSELQLGDYVVHVEHGIALYLGLQEIPSTDNTPDARQGLVLEFQGGARLYVPIEQAYLVAKYVGAGRVQLDALGGSRWERAKTQAQRAVMDYAAELLKVHAERETLKGYAFEADGAWQKEFEDAFLYQETEDQLRAIAETKCDMESPRPMDRLICGDVGFGKTEVAIRAAFKAVMGGKQVAFLAPTTVLAQQHWQTLSERMADYPVRVEVLSRFRSKAQQKATLQSTADGSVDILIGTHRLISKDVKFKNLGLVIIDEEQRFGVKQKEKFKSQFRLVDVLTLSATPIPRTLYLSMMGARDLSLIETAPANRLPVETTVAAYDERLIRNAIERELKRGGQVFFLHNRVQSIENVASKIQLLIPQARIEIGHGQMETEQLEEVMDRFVRHETDVLVSTSIIESGIDIPNANTIIIDRADRFGLADLYQLRGRVGRAQNRAYALLLLPRELMNSDGRKRVQAIQQYSQLGSGYKIAMRDLELRGAGNLLGTAQSGHIAAIGFDMYCKLLKRAVEQMKGKQSAQPLEVFMRLDFLKPHEPNGDERLSFAYIPQSYMEETSWRISAHRSLSEAVEVTQLEQLKQDWLDRFGKLPEPVSLLLEYHRIRVLALKAKIEWVEVKESKIILKRNHDYVMIGSRFPRLTQGDVKSRLQQLQQWISSFVKA